MIDLTTTKPCCCITECGFYKQRCPKHQSLLDLALSTQVAVHDIQSAEEERQHHQDVDLPSGDPWGSPATARAEATAERLYNIDDDYTSGPYREWS